MLRFLYKNLLILWSVCIVIATTNPETSKYVYNSSDLSYLSNGIQFPVPASEVHVPVLEDASNGSMPEMQWFRELYDHMKWSKNLQLLNNSQCKDDMLTYIEELHNGTSWAAKMYDASGRYSGQFFFGNDYWLGSKTLCRELGDPNFTTEIPPFLVKFYVAKVRININQKLTPVTRQLNIGECLPLSCTMNDVRLLLAQQPNRGVSLHIVGIRPVPGDYNFIEDQKFQIVGGVCVAVIGIILIASITELMIMKRNNKIKSDVETEHNNNNNNNMNNTKDSQTMTHSMEFKKNKGILLRLLLCFSALSNGKKILSVAKLPDDSIRCIHGLRFFSIAWIIMVHTYLEVFAVADNKNVRTITERTFMYQTISNATFSVDTFFFISGLLVTITYFRSAAKKAPTQKTMIEAIGSNCSKFLLMVLYRFLRLTPAYLLVLGVNEVILRYLHSYSVFSPAIIDHISCSNFWWRNALYINNFYPQTEFCMLWSWYISNDTQFYVIAAALLVIAVKSEKHLKFAGAALGIFMISSWIMTFIIAMKYNYIVRVEEPFALFDQLYDKPWMRIGPYLIGMLCGYFLFKFNTKIKLSPIMVTIGWILSLSCLSSLVYGVGKQGLVVPVSAFYASFGHTAWGISLAWITIACCSGYGGPLCSLFEFKLFLPLSRLTYCAYLVHPVFMCLSSFILDGPLHLHELFVVVIYCGNLIFSFGSAFLISLAFEAPVVNLLKIIF